MRSKLLLLTTCILIACSTIASEVKAPPPTVKVQPSPYTAPFIGHTFDLNITVADIQHVWSWSLNLAWDPAIIKCLSVTEGPFLKNVGSTLFPPPFINNYLGKIPDMGCTLMAEVEASGSGTLVTIRFNATGLGTTAVTMGDIYFLDMYSAPIDPQPTPTHGSVIVVPEFPASLILPLFIMATAAIAIIAKVFWKRKRWGPVKLP